MATAKPETKPEPKDPTEFFTFTAPDGVEYSMPNRTSDVINFGFMRANRWRDDSDFTFVVIETLAGDGPEGQKILDALAPMYGKRWSEFREELTTHIGASRGE